MASSSPSSEPITDYKEAEVEVQYGSDGEQLPEFKSDIERDPHAPRARRKYRNNDIVIMTVRDKTGLSSGTFRVKSARGHNKQYWEYRLIDVTNGTLFGEGQYYRERDLKPQEGY